MLGAYSPIVKMIMDGVTDSGGEGERCAELLAVIADYYQGICNLQGRPLIEIALERSRTAAGAAGGGDLDPDTVYAGVAAAALSDIAVPWGNVTVSVETDEGAVRWDPLRHGRLADLGRRCTQSPAAAGMSDHDIRLITPILAWRWLPVQGRAILANSPQRMADWCLAVAGDRDTPLAFAVDPQVAERRRWDSMMRAFLRYVQGELDRGAGDDALSPIFIVEAGVFVARPDGFSDFSGSEHTRIPGRLASAGLLFAAGDGIYWNLTGDRLNGRRHGVVLDAARTGLVIPADRKDGGGLSLKPAVAGNKPGA